MPKAWEMKAEPMTTSQLDRWLAGKVPRRHLAIPFGGPLSGSVFGKADNGIGYDVDGEYFHPDTDLYGPLRDFGRERLVDWHHVTFGNMGLGRDYYQDPAGVPPAKGAILGRIVLDSEASTEEIDGDEYTGIWSDFWANAGERRRAMIAALERKAVPMFGSSQPLYSAVRKSKAGAIDVWPVRFHTITTSPQNTHAVLPALPKGLLDDPYLAELSVGALRAFLTGEDNLQSSLGSDPSQLSGSVKAGRVLSGVNEQDIDEAVAALLAGAERLKAVIARHRKDDTE